MSIKLPLEKMTVAEKLKVMESLWDDLSRTPSELESPEWHGTILAERRSKIKGGKGRFKDWQKAKSDIRKKIQ
ncbi:MAG TPA: addiction module protein [Terriglobia bacterium]|nr:addiction module protein [Terriglobia bacterium]